MTTIVYTDGACLGNPGPGGWAWAVAGSGGRCASGSAAATTNQRMEITAALEAVQTLEGPLEVVSDSTYVVNCFRDRWWEGWMRRGWLNSAKKPVANRDLWEPMVAAVRADPGRVRFRWVKGHSGDPMNDLVDRLAVEAAVAAKAGGAPGTAHAAPVGRLVVVTGHRPPELGGYQANQVGDAVRSRLMEILAAKRQIHSDLVVLTGLGLGAEQLGAEAAALAGVPYVAVLAYPDPDTVWPAESRQHYRTLVTAAADRVVLADRTPSGRPQAAVALRRRDTWLARHASEAIVVWDGTDAGVGHTVLALQDSLGEEEVWILTPPAPVG